jgi:hypothetical protein
VVACPRNHLDLLHRRAALIERPFSVCGERQDARKIAEQVDLQPPFSVRRQLDPV